MRITILIILGMCFLFSCKNASSDSKESTSSTTTSTTETTTSKFKYKLTPFALSTQYNDAKMERALYGNGSFAYTIADGTSYKLGEQTPDAAQKNCANSGKGQHIHVLIDDKPYAARYTAEFSDLPLEEGEHLMLSFLSRSYHESIKTKDAHKAMKVTVSNNTITKSSPISDPMVWYSRPKGTYKGKANTDKVMLDFYLINTDLTTGNTVKADINGEVHIIPRWQPYYIEGLPMGKNKITLSLLDSSGNLIPSPQNPISREFTLEADPTEL